MVGYPQGMGFTSGVCTAINGKGRGLRPENDSVSFSTDLRVHYVIYWITSGGGAQSSECGWHIAPGSIMALYENP